LYASCQILLTILLGNFKISRKYRVGKTGKMEFDDIIETFYTEEIQDAELMRMFREAYERRDKERYSYIIKQEEIKNKTKYIFLTINPNAQITLLEFIKTIEKMMTKSWITNYLYVIEQRGETLEELGKGFHFHLILEKPQAKSYQHMIRELSNTANKVCDTSNFHFFNIKNISEEEKERKIQYITGTKADAAKHKKQEMDIIFRKNNNLLSYYNIGII